MLSTALPTDWKSWCVFFAVTLFVLRRPPLRTVWYSSWLSALLTSSLAALSALSLLTALSFVPDDWSANRLTWSAGLIRGYHLYGGEHGPSNGFFYPPVGAWFYLPAAAAALHWQAPWLGQLLGWSLSMACVLFPLSLAVNSSREASFSARIITLLLIFCLVMASPPLRYVATMVHVDAPSILFIGLALYFLSKKRVHSQIKAVLMGCLLCLAAFTKQSTWPLIPAYILTLALLEGWNTTRKVTFGFIAASIILLFVSWIFEAPSEMGRMVWVLPLSQASVTPIAIVIPLFFREGWPVLILLGILIYAIYGCSTFSPKKYRFSLATLLMGAWMVPFVILTRTKLGGDSNHFALPFFCILMAAGHLLPDIIDKLLAARKPRVPEAIIFLILFLLPAFGLIGYFSTNCGLYLWNHNSQQQALDRLRHPHYGLYLPWQVLPMLIVDGKLYHLDDCLRYENGMGWHRSRNSITHFLPEPLTSIAIRPFGAPSYLADNLNEITKDELLPSWSIFKPRPIVP